MSFSMPTRAFSSRVYQVDSWSPIVQAVKKIDRSGLVVCDVDGVLIRPKVVVATDTHYSFVRELGKSISSEMNGDIQKKWNENYYHSLIYLHTPHEVIDPSSLELVKDLNKNRIASLALTALNRGSYGQISEVLDWRIQDLRKLDYEFGGTFNPTYCFQFKNDFNNALTAYRQGFLFSSNIPKGKVLKAFLDRISFRPSEIIFVDDRESNVQSISDEMEKEGIKTNSFHYTGEKLRGNLLNERIARIQIQHLLQHEVWLSDSDANKKQ